MAATVTVTKVASGDPNYDGSRVDFVLVIVETSVAAATEVEIDPDDPAGDGSAPALPRKGRVHSRTGKLASGTGTTIQPVLGSETDPAASSAWRMSTATAAALVHDQPANPVKYALPSGSLYHRSVPDAGSDNSVTTTYYITAGWE